MAIQMLRFKVTPYGTYESGQVVAGLPAHMEYQLMESGDAVSAEVVGFANEVVAASGISFRQSLWSGERQAVSVRNPLAIASIDEPSILRLSFQQGECLDPSLLKVYNSAGVEVPCQWEYAKDPATWEEVDKSWPDGSVRRGALLILESFAASEEKEFTVRVSGTPNNYAQRVLYNAESATVWTLTTPALQSRMGETTAWIPKILRDPSRGNFNLNSTGNGVDLRFTLAGINKFLQVPADVTAVSSRRIDESNPGYGVVYQEIESKCSYAAAPGVTVYVRTRHFANNRAKYEVRVEVADTIASGNHGLSMYHTNIVSPTPTRTYDTTNGYVAYSYANGARLVFGMSCAQQESDAYRLNGSSPMDYTAQQNFEADYARIGWSKNPTTITAGAYFRFAGYYATEFDTAPNECLRCNNPIIARANSAARSDILRSIRYSARRLIDAWLPIGLADPAKSFYGSVALGWMVAAEDDRREPPIRDALVVFQRWCAEYNIAPADASSWHAKWNHSTSQLGLEFIGPASGCLPIMREKAIEQGMTVVAAQITSYIHAMADFAVQAEVTSGGSGQVKLRYDAGDNYNAEATAMLILCRSLSITANATRQATLDRIAARFVVGYTTGGIGNKMGYSYQSPGGTLRQSIQDMRASYHFYNLGVALHAHSIYPCLPALPDARQFALEYSNGRQLDERKWSKQLDRRGIVGNWISAAYVLAMAPGRTDGDLRACADYLDYVSARAGLQNPGTGILIDGYVYPDTDGGYGLWGGPESASFHMHLLHAINNGVFD